MANKTTAPTSEPVETASTPAAPAPTETISAWRVFGQAKLMPVRVDCQDYPIKGQNFSDFSCHTKLVPSSETFKRHMAAEHGGGFQIYLRRQDGGKPSPLWDDLATSGLEAGDLRCEICDEKLRFHPSSFERHMKPHNGKNRWSYKEMKNNCAAADGMLNVRLGLKPSASEEFEEELS